MHRRKNSPAAPSSPAELHSDAGDRSEGAVCENLQCAHYDLHDPGGNSCTLLFALSEEGCGAYALGLV